MSVWQPMSTIPRDGTEVVVSTSKGLFWVSFQRDVPHPTNPEKRISGWFAGSNKEKTEFWSQKKMAFTHWRHVDS